MIKLIKKIGLALVPALLITGCTYNKNDNQLALDDVINSKWHLVEMKGFDSNKEAYQKFYISFSEGLFGGKAFNSFSTSADIKENGSIKFEHPPAVTRMALRSPEFYTLESEFIRRSTTASTWRTKGEQFILGSGEDQLIFKQFPIE